MKPKTIHEMEMIKQKMEMVADAADQVKILAQAMLVGTLAISLVTRLIARKMSEKMAQEEQGWFAEQAPDSDLGFQ